MLKEPEIIWAVIFAAVLTLAGLPTLLRSARAVFRRLTQPENRFEYYTLDIREGYSRFYSLEEAKTSAAHMSMIVKTLDKKPVPVYIRVGGVTGRTVYTYINGMEQQTTEEQGNEAHAS